MPPTQLLALLPFPVSSMPCLHLYFLTLPVPTLQDIATVYQIFPDEVLGSGQFGVVYGGKDASDLIQKGSCGGRGGGFWAPELPI